MGIGLLEGVLIAAIFILCFGSKRIPRLGKTLGESIKAFKEGIKSNPKEDEEEDIKHDNKNS